MEIKTELKNNNFKFKHSLGQNFITDTNLLKAIVKDSNIEKTSNVLEIGAGAGTLTSQICLETSGKVVSVEIDKNLKPILDKLSFENLEIKFNDILKISPQEIKQWFNGQPFCVVANLPYYISTPIIFYLLENQFNITSITVMLQLEVANRLGAKVGTKDYGALTIILDYLGKVTLTRKVPKTMFTPQPKVDSAIVRIDITDKKFDVSYSDFAPFVKKCFVMRRKTLLNNITKAYDVSKEDVQNALKTLNLNLDVRAENLTTENFVSLYKKLFS